MEITTALKINRSFSTENNDIGADMPAAAEACPLPESDNVYHQKVC
jgi:hypothetical protein